MKIYALWCLPVLLAGDRSGNSNPVIIAGDHDTISSVGGHDTTQLSAVTKATKCSQP